MTDSKDLLSTSLSIDNSSLNNDGLTVNQAHLSSSDDIPINDLTPSPQLSANFIDINNNNNKLEESPSTPPPTVTIDKEEPLPPSPSPVPLININENKIEEEEEIRSNTNPVMRHPYSRIDNSAVSVTQSPVMY